MTLFKICGLRDSASALAAWKSGAAMLGFAFVEGVRRQLSPDQGCRIISEFRDSVSGRGPELVGLFANQSAEFVNEVSTLCGLDYAQLCGDEPPEMWDRLNVHVIRQVKVREDLPRDVSLAMASGQVAEALESGHLAVLDKYQVGHLGGTGFTFDWNIAHDIARDHPVVLAGGLTPDNVSEAISTVMPWAVDVSSGVETDGAKDHAKIRAFAAAVRSAGS